MIDEVGELRGRLEESAEGLAADVDGDEVVEHDSTFRVAPVGPQAELRELVGGDRRPKIACPRGSWWIGNRCMSVLAANPLVGYHLTSRKETSGVPEAHAD